MLLRLHDLNWWLKVCSTKKSFPFAVVRCTYRGLVKCAKGPSTTRVLLRWENVWFQTVALSVSSNVFVCAWECEWRMQVNPQPLMSFRSECKIRWKTTGCIGSKAAKASKVSGFFSKRPLACTGWFAAPKLAVDCTNKTKIYRDSLLLH